MASRLSTIFWMILIVVVALGLYIVKYQVQAMQEELVKQENILREERESLHVLEAEWAYLNRPDRLQALTSKYLKTSPAISKQISSIESIPLASEQQAAAVGVPAIAGNHITPVKATTHER